jgi:hypothetical protein
MQGRHVCALVFATGCVVGPRPPGGQDPANQDPALLQINLTLTAATPGAPSVTSQPPPQQQANLFLSISRIDVEDASATWHTLSDRPQRFDVLGLGGHPLLLASSEVDATLYQRARIVVDSASLQLAGSEQPVEMGYGAAATDIDMPLDSDASYNLVLGFDLSASFTTTNTGYAMTPYINAQAFYAD